LVSDIPAEDGKISNLFFTVWIPLRLPPRFGASQLPLLSWPNLARKLLKVPTLQRTNNENSKQMFPEKELLGQSSSFHVHVPVSDLCIPTIDLPFRLQEIYVD
jgi:hypothetical protein